MELVGWTIPILLLNRPRRDNQILDFFLHSHIYPCGGDVLDADGIFRISHSYTWAELLGHSTSQKPALYDQPSEKP